MIEEPSPASAPKLLDQVRGKIRLKHYSLRTEQTCVDWIKRHILFHGKHPRDMGTGEVDREKWGRFLRAIRAIKAIKGKRLKGLKGTLPFNTC